MDQTTQATLINIVNNVVVNFNQQVAINLFFYFATATAGVITASKIVNLILEWVSDWVRYKWSKRYERRMEEIKELNTKTHDRLVELSDAIECGKLDSKTKIARVRLLYNASRFKKYDKNISLDIVNLLRGLTFNADNTVTVIDLSKTKETIESVRAKIDKLWYGIS